MRCYNYKLTHTHKFNKKFNDEFEVDFYLSRNINASIFFITSTRKKRFFQLQEDELLTNL